MRPQKGQVTRSIRKDSNMAPSKGVAKGKTGVSELNKRKVIVKKLAKAKTKKAIPSKLQKQKSAKSTQMGIAKSFGIPSKPVKITKASDTATSPAIIKESDLVDVVSAPFQEKKKDLKLENVRYISPERKKNRKDTEPKKSSQSSDVFDSKVTGLTKNKRTKIINKVTKKRVTLKQAVVKKVKPNISKKNKLKTEKSKTTPKIRKSNENKSSNVEKKAVNDEKIQDCNLEISDVTKESQKPNVSKKTDESIESKAKTRTSSPEKKLTIVKTVNAVVSPPTVVEKKQSPKSSKGRQTDTADSQKKSTIVQKVSKTVPRKLLNKNKESDANSTTTNIKDESTTSPSNAKVVNTSDSGKDIKNIGLPSFSNTQSISPSGRKKLIGKVKPIARVKGTVIQKLISDPAIQQNVTVVSPNLTLLEDVKSKTTASVLKTVDDVKKSSTEKDQNKASKISTETTVSPSRSDISSVGIPPPQEVAQILPNKSKVVSVGKAKKEISLKNIPKLKKTVISKGSVVKGTPKVPMIKNVKLAKRLLKVSRCSKLEDSTSDSVSSSDDVTYSFPETLHPAEGNVKDNNQSLKSKSAIKSKVVKCLPKKFMFKNKKCQGLNRGISQAHSKEKKSKCFVSDKDNTKIEKDSSSDPVNPIPASSEKSEENNVPKEATSVPKHSTTEVKSQDSQKSTDLLIKDNIAPIEMMIPSKDALSDSKNDADDEEERYSFPEIKKEPKSTTTNKKKKPTNSLPSKPVKKIVTIPVVDDNKRRKLIGFWTGPKKYREASLNALAKVQCLYENESRSHVELGLMRTIDRVPLKCKDPKKPVIKTEKRDSTSSSSESEYEKKIKQESASSEDDSDPPVKRNLRQHPTGAGKYWEMKLSSSEESEAEHKKPQTEKKKVIKTKVVIKSEKTSEPKSDFIKTEKPAPSKPKKPHVLKKKRNRNEVVMDLRDMVVRKRMASLNATAILAASYEKRSPKSSKDESTSDSTSSEREEKKAKKTKGQSSNEKSDNTTFPKKEFSASSAEVKTKTMIVNQEADVTITGVYATHTAHTGFCTVSEMQYRISATSHTQTSATAAGEKELPSGGPSPSPSYTPLSALSSMHPPGGVSGIPQQHVYPGPSMESRGPLVGSLGRRAGCSSAFSAPPHHHPESDRSGYYQPAGPLISPGPLHGGFKTDNTSGAGSAPPPQDPGYGRYQYPPQQMMHYNPHSHSPYGPGSGYGPPAPPPAPPPRLPAMPPPPSAPACYRPPPPAHRSHPPQHQPHPPYRPPPPPDNQVSPAGAEAYAPQYCPPCYQHPHVPPRPAISYLDSAYQGCPCPMQSCPKNVHTGPATGNPPASSGPSQSSSSGGKRVGQESSGGGCCAVALNPSLGLVPPETLGPPSPARGSAGLDPPHPPRRARLGKAMARKSIAPEEPPGHTMLLMCHPTPPPPLTINTDPPPPKVETVKNEEDSGDDVIIIDSPSSKLAPIDLSSSDENNCTDSKSEKDCEIIRREENNPVVVDLSVETKKELQDASPTDSKQPVQQTLEILSNVEEPCTVSNVTNNIDSVKKVSDSKPKTGTKRRCSNLEIDMEVEIDDSLAANGIGEHVKLQKRQKVANNDSVQPKKNGAMASYKGLMKKNNRLLNNSSSTKKNLNPTKVDKLKQSSKPMTLLESDKSDLKKVGTKRKSTTLLVAEAPINKRKKLSSSLLKSADKKHAAKFAVDVVTVDKSQKKNILSVPKAKSVTLLDNLIMKNNLDRVIDCVARNIPSDMSESPSVLNPAALFNVTTTLTTSPKASRKVSMLKPKKCTPVTEEMTGIKSRTVLNINNNVVKKVSESECGVVPIQKVERKLSTEKRGRTKSKSPAALNRITEKKSVEITAKIKNQSESENIVKDIPVAILKVEGVIKGKKSTKGHSGLSGKGGHSKRKSKLCDNAELEEEDLALLKRPIGQPRWSNGWIWEGEPQLSKVYVNNEDTWIKARCWSAMRHTQAGDTVKRGDSVLLRAGAKRSEAPYVARVSQLWENPPDGEMMVSLLWYYRPEHTERGRQPEDCLDEVFASRHRDSNSVACIEDKCYVLTYNEYCRYRKQLRASEENVRCPPSIVPSLPQNEVTPSIATNDAKIPLNISSDLVLFCRRVYDFRLKKVLPPTRP